MASYASNLVSVVQHTFVGFALSVSKDVGMLEVLLNAQNPLTSHEIADKKDLKERYVRELLASLATAEVVHVSTSESGALVYHLDEDEKALLRSSMIVSISGPVVLSSAYDTITSIVRKTGPYERGIDVLEVGCGRGRLTAKLALMFPKSTFTASDNAGHLLDHLKANFGHISNMKYDMFDLCSSNTLPSKQYDWVFCACVIHDVPNPPAALKNIRKVMKVPCGIFTMIDAAPSGSPLVDRGNPMVATMYVISSFFCVPESYTDEDSHALGLCYGKERTIDFLTAAGFQVKVVDHEYPTSLFVCK